MPPRDTPLDELLPLLEADERATAAELEVTLPGDDITLAPGERGELVGPAGQPGPFSDPR